MSEYDTDGDYKFDWDDLVRAQTKKAQERGYKMTDKIIKKLRAFFDLTDKDHNGRVTVFELEDIVNSR